MAAQALKELPTEPEEALGEVGETVEVKSGGKLVSVTVKPFRLRQFAQVLKCVQRLRDCGVIEEKTLKDMAAAGSTEEAVKGFDMVKMFLDGGDEIINILSIAVGGQIHAHVLDDLDLVGGARLAAAVFSVNLDFFYRNRAEIQVALSPAVQAIEKVATQGVAALGQPPSTDSSEQDTD